MAAPSPWPMPSERVTELIRAGARAILADPATMLDAVDDAVLAASPERIAQDPALSAAMRATNHENVLYWARANVRSPGAPVAANLIPEVLDVARDIVRRGLDDSMLTAYRIGQNVAWRTWMALAFTLTEDPVELRELLDVTSRSIFAFVDATIAGIEEQIDRERAQLTGGTHAERLEVVNLILEGAPITSERASARLRYELRRRHTAAILWSADGAPGQGELERAADLLARAAGARSPFTVVASASSLWVWFATEGEPDPGALRAALERAPNVRAALGSTAPGIRGFRAGHLDALMTQRLMHRMPSALRFAAYEEIQLVALTAGDEERAAEFVTRTLGELATADPELRETLRVYLREQSSASRAARALFAHRNTVLNRLQRAQALLPRPLEHHGLQVGLALELLHWLGPPRGGPPAANNN